MTWNDRISQRLKLRDLHFLMTVAQAGSMSKAARSLSVSQPVLSKTIADLESLLGARLLDRGPRGVELTSYGQTLLSAGHAIFDELRLGVKEVERLADPTSGELSVGSNEASTIGIVPATIERMRRDYPRMTVRVHLANTTAEQQIALRERRIDFSIGRMGEPVDPEEFESEVLFNQRQEVVAGAQNPWTRRRRVDLADLLGEPWVLPPNDTMSGRLAAAVFLASGLPMPRVSVVTSSFLLNRGLLERGPYLAMMPATLLTSMKKYAPLQRVAVALPRQDAPVGVIKLRHRTPSHLAARFIETAREIAATYLKEPWA